MQNDTRVLFSLNSGKFTVKVAGQDLGSIDSADLCKAICGVYPPPSKASSAGKKSDGRGPYALSPRGARTGAFFRSR